MEQTFAIIKPDGVANGLVGEIIKRIEEDGIRLAAMRLTRLDRRRAEGFYYVHRSKPFFSSLIDYMTSGPCLLMVLTAPDVINRWRELMGPTNPDEAPRGTIRGDMGLNIERNVVHGSDSPQSALYEINYFFRGTDIVV
ncbi:MAG TPA: nucleoside-diphosphate kinase [Caldithrix abyssi]|uniref:Nucleoside diphosphate kinase n=1 Tax=Caldithrix abyssi TaxID=187145 RepID=A0A7V4U2F9_CALAY|nr:nucleoside-diphosphate kinase [Caldithrix abyssi]